MKNLYIIGASGFGREVLDTVNEINKRKPEWKVAGFIDDDSAKKGELLGDVPVLGSADDILSELRAVAASGKNAEDNRPWAVTVMADAKIREAIVQKCGDVFRWATIVHPLAFVSDAAEVAEGCIIQQFASVNANVRIERHCTLNCSAVIGHDTIIHEFSSLMPFTGIMGNCELGPGAFAGVGSMSIQGVKIGAGVTIGAGAVIIRDVPDGAKVVGNPARRIG
jgi:sugar O-acyltransferase (sialic acid O-acetyltransferase NeuD family)